MCDKLGNSLDSVSLDDDSQVANEATPAPPPPSPPTTSLSRRSVKDEFRSSRKRVRQSFVAMSNKLSVVTNGVNGGGGSTTRNNASDVLRKSTLALSRMNSKGLPGRGGHHPQGHEGFDELRAFVKQGSEFAKELVATLHERSELEMSYAKGLGKLSGKLFRSCKGLPSGTVSNAWHFIAEDMESTADTHRSMATLMVEELVKPLKAFAEAQTKARKGLEALVERRAKAMAEWRTSEAKARGKCYGSCRDNERVQDAVLDSKLGRGRVPTEKELLKLDGKRKKSEEAVRKTDLEYYACCLKAERARLEWESGILRGCAVFRQMEEERLEEFKLLAVQYQAAMNDHRPRLVSSAQRLGEPIRNCRVELDMETVDKKVSLEAESMGDQILPCFYAEDSSQAMNAERRRESLSKFLRVIGSDIDREKKGRAGVENLAKALAETPKFGSEDSQQDVKEKLVHMRSMVTFMEATRFKVINSLMDLEGRPRISHPISSYLEATKDKSGVTTTVLRIPYWARKEQLAPIEYEVDTKPSPRQQQHLHAPHSGWSSSSNSSVGDRESLSHRGRADGGVFPVERQSSNARQQQQQTLQQIPLHKQHRHLTQSTQDFTSLVQEELPFGDREPADGGDNLDDDDSDFDDFSDDDGNGGDHVNIIAVVNGISSPIIAKGELLVVEAEMNREEEPMHNFPSVPQMSGITSSEDDDEVERDVEDEEVNLSASTGSPLAISSPVPNNTHQVIASHSQDKEVDEIYYTEENKLSVAVPSLGRCTAVYDYVANMYDELNIRVGDVINIHDKQEDGWWLGELNGVVGIFPATYVE